MEQYDLLIIGAGPGGYSAAIAAAKRGLRVALFEEKHVGGTCLNVGCIPTKYLIDKALTLEKIRGLTGNGILSEPGCFSFRKIIAGKDETVSKLVGGVQFLLKKAGVRVVEGHAVLKENHVVACGQAKYRGDNIIIATGADTFIIPIPGHELCISSSQALSLSSLPERMAVIGGGVIGLELACAFAAFGTEITIIEMLPELMGQEQKEAVRLVIRHMEQLGIQIKTGAKMLRVEKQPKGLKAVYEYGGKEESLDCDQVLMAAGRKARLSGIDAATLGLQTSRGCLCVDEHQETNLPGVYAIGDVAGGYQLAHAAYAEGETALAHILGETHTPTAIPVCTYTIPALARVGLTTEAAKAAGYDPVLGTFDLKANGMALAEGDSGAVFAVADKTSRQTLGITIVSEHAAEMIAFASQAVNHSLSLQQWEDLVVAHPSLCEAVREAALDAFSKAVHKA